MFFRSKNPFPFIEAKIKSYQQSFKKFGISPQALQWKSTQLVNQLYQQLIIDLDFNHKTILDVGCGFADILPYIKKTAKDFKYTGVDLIPEFIKVCQQKYPQHQFIVRDYFHRPLTKKYDIIISSGALNSNIPHPYQYRQKTIKTLFSHCREAVIFNMAGSYPQPKNIQSKPEFFSDSLTILKFCLDLSSKVIFRHHYDPKSFTVIIFK